MNKPSLIRIALLALALVLPWSAGAAPSDNEQAEGEPAPSPAECNQLREQRQSLLQEHSNENAHSDYQKTVNRMDTVSRKRLEKLERQLKRCQ